jgi:hypothetical protein
LHEIYLDVLHEHDFGAIISSMPDAIATLHQNEFDAITLLHLSISMQETTDRCERLLHQLASNVKLMKFQDITSLLALLHQKIASVTG